MVCPSLPPPVRPYRPRRSRSVSAAALLARLEERFPDGDRFLSLALQTDG
jgi:hypothetical protein